MASGDKVLGRNSAVGTQTMTGSAVTIITGFRPAYVRLVNITKKTTAEWFTQEGDAKCFVDNDTGSGTEDMSEVTTNGITPVFNGFTIGSSSLINNNNDVVYWYAIKV